MAQLPTQSGEKGPALGRLGLHLRRGGLQLGANAQAAAMTGPATCELIGRWRIIEADLWDRDYLDLVEPAHLQIGNDGWAEFALGAVNATVELKYGRGIVFFDWRVRQGRRNLGDGATELQDDGSIKIRLSFDNGDDTVLTARHQ